MDESLEFLKQRELILAEWNNVKLLVESLEKEIKHSVSDKKGFRRAMFKARRGLRMLENEVKYLKNISLENTKLHNQIRKIKI